MINNWKLDHIRNNYPIDILCVVQNTLPRTFGIKWLAISHIIWLFLFNDILHCILKGYVVLYIKKPIHNKDRHVFKPLSVLNFWLQYYRAIFSISISPSACVYLHEKKPLSCAISAFLFEECEILIISGDMRSRVWFFAICRPSCVSLYILYMDMKWYIEPLRI